MFYISWSLAALDRRTWADCFWWGEIETELRLLDCIDYRFHCDADREVCMKLIETERQKNLYPHEECFPECQARGCAKLWVTDGIWKLQFAHCMYHLSVCTAFCAFYPRPVLAFGYCLRLRLCVCPCVCQSVCQSLACPRDNSGPVQARVSKFGPKMQKTLVKVPIVLGGNWPWPSRSNLTSKSEFTHFWAYPDHNSSPIQVRITKFGPEVQNSLVKVPIILGDNSPWPSRSNLI